MSEGSATAARAPAARGASPAPPRRLLAGLRLRSVEPGDMNVPFVDAALSAGALGLNGVIAAAFLVLAASAPARAVIGVGPGWLALLVVANLLPSVVWRLAGLGAAARAVQVWFLVAAAHLNLVLISVFIAAGGRPFTPLWAFFFAHVSVLAGAFGFRGGLLALLVLTGLAPGVWFQVASPRGDTQGWLAVALFTAVAAWMYALVGGLIDRMRDLRLRSEEAERRRALAEQQAEISREIHDGVGAELTASLLLGHAAQALAASAAPGSPRLHATLGDIVARLDRALAETRLVLWALDPATCLPAQLLERIDDAARDLCRETGIEFASSLEGDTDASATVLPAPVKQHAFRIVQEAVTNALRHSGARRLEVRVAVAAGTLRLRVTDDGAGIDAASASPRGHGLANMRARAAQLGGSLEIGTDGSGRGTQIRLTVPLRFPAVAAPR